MAAPVLLRGLVPMTTHLSLGHNAVGSTASKEVMAVIRSGQLSPGPKVREFETKFSKLHKAGHGVFVNSGTDALRIALAALKEKYDWKYPDEVAVSTLTFVATVNVILQAGLKPFFYDAGNPWNLKMRMQTGETRLVAIMPVHLFGDLCNKEIFELARIHKLKVLEDSCETILNPLRGDISCYSTYMAHHVTTGVGGMAITDDMDLNLLMRSYANHGRNISYLPGYATPKLSRNLLASRFRFDRIGFSCRATEFEAVLGLSQLDTLAKSVVKRRQVAKWYWRALQFCWDKFDFREPEQSPDHTFMMYPICARESFSYDKYDLCLALEKAGIETRDMMPITTQPCYKLFVNPNDYPVSKHVNQNGFYVPCHPGMDKKDVDYVATELKRYLHKL